MMKQPAISSNRLIWRLVALAVVGCAIASGLALGASFDLKACFSLGEVKVETIESELENDHTAAAQYKRLHKQLKTITDSSFNPRHTLYLSPNYPLAQLTAMVGALQIGHDRTKLNANFGAEFLDHCKSIVGAYKRRLSRLGGSAACGQGWKAAKLKLKIGGRLAEVYRFCKYMTKFTYNNALEQILLAPRNVLGDVRYNDMRMMSRFGEHVFGRRPFAANEPPPPPPAAADDEGLLERPRVCAIAREFIVKEQDNEADAIANHNDFLRLKAAKPTEWLRHFMGGLRSSCLELSNQMHDILWLMKRNYLIKDGEPVELSPRSRRLIATLDACGAVSQCDWEDLNVEDRSYEDIRGPIKSRWTGLRRKPATEAVAGVADAALGEEDSSEESAVGQPANEEPEADWASIGRDIAELRSPLDA